MIAVVGVPAWRETEPAGPAGRCSEIALAAAAKDARVELVGRAGDDPAGDALLIALARAGVGHAAMLRDPARRTPVVTTPPEADRAVLGDEPLPPAVSPVGSGGPRLDVADVALGLGYVTDFRVLVVADDVPADALPAAIDAAAFAGAHLVVLVPPDGSIPAAVPSGATVLAVPGEADDGAFGAFVGAYAAALDAGAVPAEAFAAAVGDNGWGTAEVIGTD